MLIASYFIFAFCLLSIYVCNVSVMVLSSSDILTPLKCNNYYVKKVSDTILYNNSFESRVVRNKPKKKTFFSAKAA